MSRAEMYRGDILRRYYIIAAANQEAYARNLSAMITAYHRWPAEALLLAEKAMTAAKCPKALRQLGLRRNEWLAFLASVTNLFLRMCDDRIRRHRRSIER